MKAQQVCLPGFYLIPTSIQKYLDAVSRHHASGIASEHAYWPNFQNLLRDLLHYQRALVALNETVRVMDELGGV